MSGSDMYLVLILVVFGGFALSLLGVQLKSDNDFD